MTQLIQVNEMSIEQLFWNKKPVITFQMMDRVHKKRSGTTHRTFNKRKNLLQDGKHYFKVSDEELIESGQIVQIFNQKGHILLTEFGYLMLVKSFQDDLAWKVQNMLVDSYFKVQRQQNRVDTSDPQTHVLRLVQAQTSKDVNASAFAIAGKEGCITVNSAISREFTGEYPRTFVYKQEEQYGLQHNKKRSVQVVLEKTDKPKAASYSLAKRLLTQGVDLPTSVKIGKSAEPMFQAILAAGLAIDEKGMGVLPQTADTPSTRQPLPALIAS